MNNFNEERKQTLINGVESTIESIMNDYINDKHDDFTFYEMEKEISEKVAQFVPLSLDYEVKVDDIGGEFYCSFIIENIDTEIFGYYNKNKTVNISSNDNKKVLAFDDAMKIL